jgi:hypothetical protein
MQFYIFFGTNLLTQCPVPVAIFCLFLAFQKINTKKSPNMMKLYGDFFWTRRDPRSFGRRPEDVRETHKLTRRAPWRARHLSLWAPRISVWPNSTSKNSQILGNQQRATSNNFSTAASLCSSAIASGGLFRYSAGGGINHGGLLHQPCCPSNDVWVVYHRPTGP